MLAEPKTNDFLDWYLYYCGESEVPENYNLWCAISLVASVVGDAVWYEKFPGKKLLPNLYVMLLGPSGSGKDIAIDWAIDLYRLLEDERLKSSLYYGKASIQFLLDSMAGKTKREASNYLYLVTPELTSAISAGKQATDFIKVMTELYISKGRKWEEGTRTKGGLEIDNPVVNWLSGTTLSWLVSNVPYDALEGGFVGRVAIAEGHYNFENRVYKPWRPANIQAVIARLVSYLTELSSLSGKFEMDSQAQSLDEAWYMTREGPEEESLAPAWKRQQDLILKVAMVLSLMSGLDGIIKAPHIVQAQELVEVSYRAVPKMNSMTGATALSRATQMAEQKIRAAGSSGITRSALVKFLSHQRITARQLDQEILPTLLGTRRIIEREIDKPGSKHRIYQWLPPRVIEEKGNDVG